MLPTPDRRRGYPDHTQPTRYGFLTRFGKRFRVRYLDWSEAELTWTRSGTPKKRQVRFWTADLAKAVPELINQLNRRFYTTPETPTNPEAMAIAFARACAQRGLTDLVHEIWNELPRRNLRRKLADALVKRLTLDFMDRRVSWAQLLARHELWLDAFPDSPYAEGMETTKDRLRRVMGLERSRNARRKGMAGLVANLRNEFCEIRTLGSYRINAWCLAPVSTGGERPVTEILKRGLVAVPALIAALEDGTPTRQVTYSCRFGGHFHARAVGELANDTLYELSGLRFWDADDWRKWFQVAKQGGIEGAVLHYLDHEHQRVTAVTAIIARYPHRLDMALSAARRCAKQHLPVESGLSEIAQRLVFLELRMMMETLSKSHDARVTEFLREQLEHGSKHIREVAKSLLAKRRGKPAKYAQRML